jgi:lysophospholipase L1-like esterase
MPETTNRKWTYPIYRKKPHYNELVSFFNEIDADVENLDNDISTLESNQNKSVIITTPDGSTEVANGVSSGHFVTAAPTTLVADPDLSINQLSQSLDETNDRLLFRAKKSGGGLQTYSVTPGGPLKTPTLKWSPYYGIRYACMGDSNTTGVTGSGYSYPAALSGFTGITNVNLGVGGKKSNEILADQTSLAVAASEGVVVVMAGTNDGPAGYTAAQTEGYLESIYAALLVGERVPVAVGILPGAAGAYKATRDVVNVWIRDYSSALYYIPVDEFDDGSGGLKAVYDYGDGVHLNVLGMETLAALIQSVVPQYLSYKVRRTGTMGTQTTSNHLNINPSAWADQIQLEAWTTGSPSPDGAGTAYGMVCNTTDAVHYARGTASGGPGVEERYEGVWLKPGLCDWVKIMNASNGSYITCNIRTGAVYITGGASLVDYGVIVGSDGWSYVWMHSSTSTLTNDKLMISPQRTAGGTSFAGDGTDEEVFVWHPFKGLDHLVTHYKETL